MVVNLCDPGHEESIDKIRRAFNDRVLVVVPEDGENKVVFAVKGRRFWVEDAPIGELVKTFLADYVPSLSLTLS
jgi:hypothetical protein